MCGREILVSRVKSEADDREDDLGQIKVKDK